MKEETFPKESSSIKGTETGWKVEARLDDYKNPVEIMGQMINHRWSTIIPTPVPAGIGGIVAKRSYTGTMEQFGLLPYAAAQCLRWFIHSYFETIDPLGLGLETRLIEHEVKCEMSSTPIAAHSNISGEDRSCILPDWNHEYNEKQAQIAKDIEFETLLVDRLKKIVLRYQSKINASDISKERAKYRALVAIVQDEIESIMNLKSTAN